MSWKKTVFKNFKLYAITDLRTEDAAVFGKVEAAYRGGADIVQLRSKVLSDAVLYRIGLQFRKIADRYRKLFFINDRPDLALATEADGVHLGQEDLSLEAVRKILKGRKLFVGRSTHSLDQAVAAMREGLDYFGVGPIFQTPTKPTYQPVGTDLIERVREKHPKIPFVCIGGIQEKNVREVIRAGAKRIAVVRGIFDALDVFEAAKNFRRILEENVEN